MSNFSFKKPNEYVGQETPEGYTRDPQSGSLIKLDDEGNPIPIPAIMVKLPPRKEFFQTTTNTTGGKVIERTSILRDSDTGEVIKGTSTLTQNGNVIDQKTFGKAAAENIEATLKGKGNFMPLLLLAGAGVGGYFLIKG